MTRLAAFKQKVLKGIGSVCQRHVVENIDKASLIHDKSIISIQPKQQINVIQVRIIKYK